MADTLTDKIVADTGYSRCIVSALVALSFPVRSMLIAFLQQLRAQFIAKKASLVGLSYQMDIIAQQMSTLVTSVRAAIAPYDTTLNAIPFAQIAANCPDAVAGLNNIFDNISIQLGLDTLTLDEFDTFKNVKNYKDFKNKLNELEFRLQRSLTIADKVKKESTDIDNSLKIIDQYLDIFTRMQ